MKRKSKAVRKTKPAKQEPLKLKTGRPLSLSDREQAIKLLKGLGSIQCTWKQCAAVLGLNEETLRRVFIRWPDVKDAYDSAKQTGLVGLRQSQFRLAEKNATMAIFLGMNYLDQKDMRNTNLSGEVKHSHEHSIVGMMLKEIDEEARGGPVIEHQPNSDKAA